MNVTNEIEIVFCIGFSREIDAPQVPIPDIVLRKRIETERNRAKKRCLGYFTRPEAWKTEERFDDAFGASVEKL